MDEREPLGNSQRQPLGLGEDERWQDWPNCPRCGQRRQTFCPTCDLDGTDFLLADSIPATAPLLPTRKDASGNEDSGSTDDIAVLLMCPDCDEAFSPRFYRKCPQCGHGFADGVDPEPIDSEELTGRMLLVICVLAATVLGLLAYYWLLFQY